MRRLLLFLVALALFAQNTIVAPITVSGASGSTKIITASASRGTRIYHISVSWNTSADVYFLYGTGTNCGSNSTQIGGAYKADSGGLTKLALDFDTHPLRVPPAF